MKRAAFITVLLAAWGLVGQHQSGHALAQKPPYVREGSIGDASKKPTPLDHGPFQYLLIDAWVGQKFIFLPKQKVFQLSGYMFMEGRKGRLHYATYEECVGRIGTVTHVAYGGVTLKMDDNGHTYEGQASGGMFNETIDDIGLVADIDGARSLWMGRTLWYRDADLATYNAESGETGDVKIKKYSAVKVIDIVAGWHGAAPVRFILQTSEGSRGFVDINPSGTNSPIDAMGAVSFNRHFLTEDPKVTFSGSPTVWAAIEDEKVFVGMTAEQARLSWGDPREINTTVHEGAKDEQWVYASGSYLYLENGVVTAIQN